MTIATVICRGCNTVGALQAHDMLCNRGIGKERAHEVCEYCKREVWEH